MRGLGSLSFSVGMPSPPPKSRRLVCGCVWERGEGVGEGWGGVGRDGKAWEGTGRDGEGWRGEGYYREEEGGETKE